LCKYNKNRIQVMPKLIVSEENPKIFLNFEPLLASTSFSEFNLITFRNKIIIMNILNAITIKVGPKKYLFIKFFFLIFHTNPILTNKYPNVVQVFLRRYPTTKIWNIYYV
jgi:hypothetical protein